MISYKSVFGREMWCLVYIYVFIIINKMGQMRYKSQTASFIRGKTFYTRVRETTRDIKISP